MCVDSHTVCKAVARNARRHPESMKRSDLTIRLRGTIIHHEDLCLLMVEWYRRLVDGSESIRGPETVPRVLAACRWHFASPSSVQSDTWTCGLPLVQSGAPAQELFGWPVEFQPLVS